jgi:gamma-carbonic anhydrase
MIQAFGNRRPQIDPSAYVCDAAVVIGDVRMGPGSSVWFHTVVRGDIHDIRIGARSNVQDLCVVHVTRGRFACEIGDEVTVGHRAVVHGCRVGDAALIGIGAIVLDGAQVGEGAVVGAGAVVTPGSKVESGVLVLGTPARVVRRLSQEELEPQRRRTLDYVETARAHAAAAS